MLRASQHATTYNSGSGFLRLFAYCLFHLYHSYLTMCFTFTHLIVRGCSDGIIRRFMSQHKVQERQAEGIPHKKREHR